MSDTEEVEATGPVEKFKYNVKLEGNRGSTVMKFTEEEAEKRGLTNDDKVDGEAILPPEPDEPTEVDEEPVTATKAKAPANKRKTTADNK